eukprot:CAMPEP_0178501868 /NCGR_PEP_ID=MMETSP0696-20121128/17191_1 /TAXON_ID=265572 /ORGANISM="Extubocellulus spinifer, Strain CCMP396" /LENGTH=44 /DNA_ID= /DNA_START= /DNA_END= /DNA_ORIENTATION=
MANRAPGATAAPASGGGAASTTATSCMPSRPGRALRPRLGMLPT